MTVPIWVMLIFALWTLGLLFASVGVYRWSRILTGRANVMEWRADEVQGSEWYRRAIRAHLNCVENLPVYSAIAMACWSAELSSTTVDYLALIVIVARVSQSIVHISTEQTNAIATVRFGLYFAQILSMVAMAGVLIASTI